MILSDKKGDRLAVWWVIVSLLVAHGSHRSDSVWRVRSDYGLVAGSVIFEPRDLRIFGQGEDGYSLQNVSDRFRVVSDEQECKLDGSQVTKAGSRLRFSAGWLCKDNAQDYRIEVLGLTFLDTNHRQRTQLDDGSRVIKKVLTPEKFVLEFSQRAPPKLNLFGGEITQLEDVEETYRPPKVSPPEQTADLSWWLFLGWCVGLFVVLAALVARSRMKRPSKQNIAPPAEGDDETERIKRVRADETRGD